MHSVYNMSSPLKLYKYYTFYIVCVEVVTSVTASTQTIVYEGGIWWSLFKVSHQWIASTMALKVAVGRIAFAVSFGSGR